MVYLLAASLLFAFSFGVIKGQLTAFDPVLVAGGRLLLAALVFGPFAWRARLDHAVVRRALVVGAVQFGLMYMLYIASFAWLPAWKVAVFTIFTPLYVVGLSALADRRFLSRYLVAAVAAVVGAALVLQDSPLGADWRGVLLLQGANLCFAWGQIQFVALRQAADGREAGLVGWMYVGACGVTLLALLARSGGKLPSFTGWTTSAGWALLYLGVLPTAVGFYLWNRGAARTGAGQLAVANNLKVPLAVLISWLIFGESVPLGPVGLGLAVILGGLAVVEPRQDIGQRYH